MNTKKTPKKWFAYFSVILLATCLMMGLSACEDDDDDFDHDIPAGQGTIVVNNQTSNDIEVYISGMEQNTAHQDDYEFYDRNPGIYRIILNEEDGDRNWYGFVDVVEGKKTILDVEVALGTYNYAVFIRIQ